VPDRKKRKSMMATSISKKDAGRAAEIKKVREALKRSGEIKKMRKSRTAMSLPVPGSLGRKLK